MRNKYFYQYAKKLETVPEVMAKKRSRGHPNLRPFEVIPGHSRSFEVIFVRSLSKTNLKMELKMVYSSSYYFDSIT